MLHTVRARVLLLVAACFCGAAAALIGFLLDAGPAAATATCSIYWTGHTSTDWDTNANWALTDNGPNAGRKPNSSDYVCMSTVPTTASVVAASATRTIAGINFAKTGTVTPALELQGGTFTVNTNASTINNLTDDGGTMNGTAAVSLTGNASMPSGSVIFAGSGVKTLAVGATLAQSTSLTVGGAGGNSQFVVSGNLTMAANTYLYETLASSGSTPNSVSTTAGGVVTMGDTDYFLESGSGPVHPFFANAGTLTTTTTAAHIQTNFTNSGTVNGTATLYVQSGNAPSTSDTGTWSVGGAGVEFDATRSVSSGSFTGATNVLTVASGTTTFGSTVTIANLNLPSGTVSGSPTVGNATLNGGTLTGAGTMTTTGANSSICSPTIDGGYTLTNTGTMSYVRDGCYPNLSNGGHVRNKGTFAISESGSSAGYIYDDSNSANGFLNDVGGSLTVALTSNTSVVSINTPFTNNGAVTVTTGQLDVGDGNTTADPNDSGSYALSAGTVVNLTSGTRTVSAGTVTGAGTLENSGATVTFASGVTLSNFDLENGTTSGSPTVGNATLNGGTLTGAGTMTTTGANSSICSPTIDGGYTLTNTGTMSYVRDGCYPNLSNGGHVRNKGTFAISESGSSAGYIYDDSNSANGFLNDVGGSLTVALTSNTSVVSINTPFTNNGAVTVTTGQLDVGDGNTTADPNDSGSYALSAGTVVNLTSGTRTVSAGTVTGAGTLENSGATVTFASGVTLSNFDLENGTTSGSPTVGNATLNGGTLTGAGTMTTTGANSSICSPTIDHGYTLLNNGSLAYSLSGCYISLSRGATLENAGTFTITGSSGYLYDDGNAANKFLNDAAGTINVALTNNSTNEGINTPFTNNGTVSVTKGMFSPLEGLTNLSAGGKLTGGTWIVNGGQFVFPNAVTNNAATMVLGATGSFAPNITTLATNSGSLTVTQNLTESVALADSGTAIAAGGTWRVNSYTQTAGALQVQTGAIFKSGSTGTSAVTITGGTLSGTGTVQGAVSGTGTVSPGIAGTGALAVTGSYTNPAAGTLAVTATGTQLNATGAVSVGGTLAITTPASVPAIGTVATVVTGSSVTGSFSAITGQDVPSAGAYWFIKYNATSVTIALTAYPSASVADVSAPEGNSGTSNETFTVSLSAASQQQVTVSYATSDGSATSPSDYASTSGTLTFNPGDLSKTINVAVNGDTLYEHDETYVLTLSTPVQATLSGAGTATGTIVNDDAAPVVSIANAGATVNATSGATISFPVTLSTASGVATSVNYATSNGTAVAGTDYTATSGTLTMPAGSTTANLDVPVAAQSSFAAPKTFTMTLSLPVDATIGTATATGTITNNNPNITSVSPGNLFQDKATTVTVNGKNFGPGSTVSVSGTRVSVSTVVVVSTQKITAKLSPASNAATGPRSLTVTTPGTGSATCANCLTVLTGPTVTSVSPPTIPRGATSATTVTITGTNFRSGAVVTTLPTTGIKITPGSTNVVDSTTITFSVTAQQKASLGLYNVKVKNPDGGGATCKCLTVAGPAVTSGSPNTINRGVATALTINGTGFDPAATLDVGCAQSGTTATATAISTTVTCSGRSPLGIHEVIVTNPDGSTFDCKHCLTVVGPNITGISPASVQRGQSAALTITGTGFVSGAAVSASSCGFTATTVVDVHTITTTITCPSNAPKGSLPITVTNPPSAGSAISTYNAFTITQ